MWANEGLVDTSPSWNQIKAYSSSIFVMCRPGITMRPINRCVMFTLTVALFASDHDSFSCAAACTADVVGIRYSKELARMIFRSCRGFFV